MAGDDGGEVSYSTIKFLHEVPAYLRCSLCNNAAKEPWQHAQCKKIFCRSCIARNEDGAEACPHCEEDNAAFYTDIKSNRKILGLLVRCENHKAGCHWVGELGALKQHLQTKCPYVLVPCPRNCKAMTYRSKQSQHLRDDCTLNKSKCPHCGESGILQNKTSNHLEVCPMVPVQCPNSNCDKRVPSKLLQDHLDSDCEFSSVNCKFEPLGCPVTLLRKEIREHEADFQHHHDILIQEILDLRNTLDSAEKKQQEYIAEIQQLEDKVEGLLTTQESAPKNTTVTLQVRRYSYYKQYRTAPSAVIYSDEGHKLQVQVTPNNIKHVSVTVTVMKGEDDNNLPWPYGGKIKIELLNQIEDSHHYERIVDYPKMYGSRVVKDHPMSMISYGALQFISREELEKAMCRGDGGEVPDSPPNVQYLVDDTLYFRVSTRRLWLQCTL